MERPPLIMAGEHWRQWIATLGPMIIFALGIGFWVVGAITTVSENSTKMYQDVMQKVLVDEGRISAVEHSLDDLKAENRSFQAQTGTSLSNIINSLSDLRVSIAHDGHPGRAP